MLQDGQNSYNQDNSYYFLPRYQQASSASNFLFHIFIRQHLLTASPSPVSFFICLDPHNHNCTPPPPPPPASMMRGERQNNNRSDTPPEKMGGEDAKQASYSPAGASSPVLARARHSRSSANHLPFWPSLRLTPALRRLVTARAFYKSVCFPLI